MIDRDVIVNLLYNLGGKSEVSRYLREYARPGASNTAVVKVGGALIADGLEDLASSVAFLKHVGMAPVLVHGAGPQLSKALEDAGVETEWVDGLRVTTPGVLGVAHRLFAREGSRLCGAIDAQGVRAQAIPTGVFEAVASDPERLGLVGRVVRVNVELVREALEAGYLPVLSPLGVSCDGQMLNINADTAARALAKALQPGKVIYLTETGGILDGHGAVIPAINVEQDGAGLIASGVVSGGMARKIKEIGELLRELPEHASVSITKPAHLARELFTHKGSGTLVRRGARIDAVDDVRELDAARVAGLLESSFGRSLVPGSLDRLGGARAFVAPWTALAVVRDTEAGAYLDKFAVTAEAQGAGVGAALWDRVAQEYPKLFWRSRVGNPINPWYMQRADGMQRTDQWLVFWRGLSPDEETVGAFRYAVTQELSFEEAGARAQEEVVVG